MGILAAQGDTEDNFHIKEADESLPFLLPPENAYVLPSLQAILSQEALGVAQLNFLCLVGSFPPPSRAGVMFIVHIPVILHLCREPDGIPVE